MPLISAMYGQGYNLGGGTYNMNWYPPPPPPPIQQLPPDNQHLAIPQPLNQQQLVRQNYQPTSSYILDHPPSNSREIRNRAEKMRRDKLNGFVNELSHLVPVVAKSAKRLDKTSVLRLTATYLRIYHMINARKNELWVANLPTKVHQSHLEELVCEQLKGFLMILTSTGKIIFVSYTVENLLGHSQTDLMGQSIFNLILPEDVEKFRMYINPVNEISELDWRKYFDLHLKRAGPRNEAPVYELVNIMGVQRPAAENSKNRENTVLNADLWVFFVRVLRIDTPLAVLLESNEEYLTRHLVDGRIINCDYRISFIAGYMKEEVSGLSAFKFMHRDDVRWVMIALRQMYDRGDSRGSSCYRLLSRTGQFIYLRTTGFLEIDISGTVESFVCVNTLVSEREGEELISMMKQKYSALIKNRNSLMLMNNNANGNETVSNAVEDPRDLEVAIYHLTHKLPSPDSDNESDERSPSSVIGEYQDDVSASPSSTYPWHLKVKTAKRPPNSMSQGPASSRKRLKGSPRSVESSPKSNGAFSSYHITDISDNR